MQRLISSCFYNLCKIVCDELLYNTVRSVGWFTQNYVPAHTKYSKKPVWQLLHWYLYDEEVESICLTDWLCSGWMDRKLVLLITVCQLVWNNWNKNNCKTLQICFIFTDTSALLWNLRCFCYWFTETIGKVLRHFIMVI